MTRLLPLPLLALIGLASAAAQRVPPAVACPCGGYGPYPCAATTVLALPDQAAALGLTSAQVDTLRALQRVHLDAAHETLGEIGALMGAVHELGRPYGLAETFALFYDLGAHYAELEDDFRIAEASLLGVLDARQRTRWTALVADAATYQEAPPQMRSAPLAAPACGAVAGR